MKKVLIIGAGPGGCAAAIAFSQIGWNVTVLEKFSKVTTRGAGILLYSNGLKSLDKLNVLDKVLATGSQGQGIQPFYDENANVLGTAKFHSVDPNYPSYVGIDRRKFLDILYQRAVLLGCKFHFETKAVEFNQDSNGITVICENSIVFENYDLLIASDGLNSQVRKKFWENAESTYSGFGLFHSTHPRHPMIDEKIAVFMPGKRFGVIPMSDDYMYIWASVHQPEKKYIDPIEQPKFMHEEFKNVSGFLKDIIDQLINEDVYVHYTSVEEVTINDTWHKGRVVLLGDAAHAATPFMAQGGSMSLQDACVLTELLIEDQNLDTSLRNYAELRKPVVKAVQQMSKNMGLSYKNTTFDIEKIQNNIDKFYLNDTYFI